ncbi:MAG: amino acid carrier protein [Lachnospiraceae bacterium]|nr:amino acid carrier protein [Lachnospiraceae bacterium]
MIQKLHAFVWGPGMLALFLFTGVLYTVRLRGFQILRFSRWWNATAGSLFKRNAGNEERAGGISHSQAACTALAATIGTGNIAGVATAILAGGPGAIFWMWVSAFLGMATAYGETFLGIRYRKRGREGNWISGAMVYLEHGLHCRWAAALYAVLCLTASFGMGSMVQANAISETFELVFSTGHVFTGILLTVLAGRIIAGGAKKIAYTAEKLVPVSAGIYMAASLAVIIVFRDHLAGAFGMIFRDAFTISGVSGGILGVAASRCVRYGVARGVFSNEAGLGSMAALNGGADDGDPKLQGQWAMFEVFFDTIVSCTVTAAVILCVAGGELDTFRGNGAALINLCFLRGLGSLGGYTVSVCVSLFAFATIVAWYYMGEQAASYLGDMTGTDMTRAYLAGYLLCVFLGSIGSMETVWEISDICNGLMALPNLMALNLLVGQTERPCPGQGG